MTKQAGHAQSYRGKTPWVSCNPKPSFVQEGVEDQGGRMSCLRSLKYMLVMSYRVMTLAHQILGSTSDFVSTGIFTKLGISISAFICKY